MLSGNLSTMQCIDCLKYPTKSENCRKNILTMSLLSLLPAKRKAKKDHKNFHIKVYHYKHTGSESLENQKVAFCWSWSCLSSDLTISVCPFGIF